MWGAIAGATGSLLGGLFGGFSQKNAAKYNADMAYKTAIESTKLQNEAAWQIAKYQNEYNTEMWNAQNEYNSPAAQMQRFKDAGLNPNLMYKQGNAGLASSPAPAADVRVDYSRYKAGPDKVAMNANVMNQFASIVGNLVDVMSRAEDLKSKKIQNETYTLDYLGDLAATKLQQEKEKGSLLTYKRRFAGDTYDTNYQSALLDYALKKQGFYLRGGGFTDAEAKAIHRDIMNDVILSPMFRRLDYVDRYNEVGHLRKMRGLAENISDVDYRNKANLLDAYEKTIKKRIDMFGFTTEWVDNIFKGLGTSLGNILPAILGGRAIGKGYRSYRDRYGRGGGIGPNYNF